MCAVLLAVATCHCWGLLPHSQVFGLQGGSVFSMLRCEPAKPAVVENGDSF